MTPVGELCTRLNELGIEHDDSIVGAVSWGNAEYEQYCDGLTRLVVLYATPAQAIAATVGAGKAKAHPWGYERDTGFFDTTCCECGELNDISAKYCNQCGREIQLDMSEIEYAEDWYTPQHTCKVNADGTLTSLRDGKTYVDSATVGAGKTTTRNGKYKTKYGRRVPLCECCGYSIGDDRYNFCPKCGAEIVGDE